MPIVVQQSTAALPSISSTILLSRTINVAQAFIRSAPITGVGGVANEPALTIADWVKQFICSPPFAWRWNRGVVTLNATVGNQDYTSTLIDFGYIEKATVNSGTEVYELNIKMDLGEEVVQNKPAFIAARLDDDTGVITFRLFPVPDTSYTVKVTYQKAVPLFNSTSDTWAPIPDYLSHLYTGLFLAKVYEYWSDERTGLAMTTALKNIIAASAGLDSTQLNVLMSDRIDVMRQPQYQLGKSQLGLQGKVL